jgi:hypothetical protein
MLGAIYNDECREYEVWMELGLSRLISRNVISGEG